MSYQLLDIAGLPASESVLFIEGAMLAANMTCHPLPPETWHPLLFGSLDDHAEKLILTHYQSQYDVLAQPEHAFYAMFAQFSTEEIADFAEGFMTVW